MKKQIAVIFVFLVCVLCLTALCGCDRYSDYEITSTPIATHPATPDEVETVAPSVDPSSPKLISEWDAQSIAFYHSNLSEAEVTMNKCELRKSNGMYLYEMEFVSEDDVYKYKINAVDGDVVSYDKVSVFE